MKMLENGSRPFNDQNTLYENGFIPSYILADFWQYTTLSYDTRTPKKLLESKFSERDLKKMHFYILEDTLVSYLAILDTIRWGYN